MRRRDFITLVGGAAAVRPRAARAQQPMATIGFVYAGETPSGAAPSVTAFHHGLSDVGFVERQNVAVEYRWVGAQDERLPAVMAELVRRPVSAIVGNTPPALAAKSATSTIPIVFISGADPVKVGLVASFNRPGGNVTGVTFLATTLEAKRLGLLRELLPKATVIAVLADPNFFTTPDQLRDLKDAAHLLGQQIRVIEASTDEQIVSGFATFDRERPDALFVASVPFLTSRRQLIIALAARYSLPAIYGVREFSEAGGLMSYGASQVDMWRQAGVYTGRILKGAKPDDLPVLQPTKYEFVINMNAAKALGIDIPVTVLAHADEVIE